MKTWSNKSAAGKAGIARLLTIEHLRPGLPEPDRWPDMEAIALISHPLHYCFAIAAIVFCVMLFRHYREGGWLFVGAVFLEPFVQLVVRAVHGWPLLPYRTIVPSTDDAIHVVYSWDFPVLYILAVVGLFLFVRKMRHDDLR